MQLDILQEMPEDIFLEVLGHLEPVDLLQVAKSSKSWHGLLGSTHAAHLWKQVFSNLPEDLHPPPFEEGQNVLYYANYLFGHNCQICGGPDGVFDHEVAQIRYCIDCVARSRLVNINKTDDHLVDLCYSTRTKKPRRGDYIVKIELLIRVKELAALDSDANVTEYRRRRQSEKAIRMNLGPRLLLWRQKWNESEKLRLMEIRINRADFARQKFKEEGYEGLLSTSQGYLANTDTLQGQRELDDEEWRSIRANVIDGASVLHQAIISFRLQTALNKYMITLQMFIRSYLEPQTHILPSAGWFARQEPLASFLQRGNGGKLYTQEDFANLVPQCLEIVEDWKAATNAFLVDVINDAHVADGEGKVDMTALQLATTFFECAFCYEAIPYLSALVHPCFTKDAPRTSQHEPDSSRQTEEAESKMTVFPREPRPFQAVNMTTQWTKLIRVHSKGMCPGRTSVSFNRTASRIARDIVLALGEDPNIVTRDELDTKDAWVECLTCGHESQGDAFYYRPMMPWTTAVDHALEAHLKPDQAEARWCKVESEDDKFDKSWLLRLSY